MTIEMRSLDFREIIAIGLLAAVFCGRPAQAAVLIDENFDVAPGTLGPGATADAMVAKGWENPPYCASTPCTMDIVSMIGHTGAATGALRMTYLDPADQYDSLIARAFPETSELYERFWIRYESAGSDPVFVSTAFVSMKHHYFYTTGISNPSVVLGYGYTNEAYSSLGFGVQHPAFSQTCPDGNAGGTCNYGPNIPPAVSYPLNQWICVETHLKLNTPGAANGVIEIWKDGVLTTQYLNAQFIDAATASQKFMFVKLFRQGGGTLYRYEDDYTLATTRVGCGGAPPSDRTPPSAPNGVIIK